MINTVVKEKMMNIITTIEDMIITTIVVKQHPLVITIVITIDTSVATKTVTTATVLAMMTATVIIVVMTAIGIGIGIPILVSIGSAWRLFELGRGGGGSVAESLGGRRLTSEGADRYERRALNVVEEMALASGTPVPPVYILDEELGINAFAAGYAPEDAVIGLTRGTIESLSRDELQGVVAHEFSHVLHGDMRLNIQLIGIVSGLHPHACVLRVYSGVSERRPAVGALDTEHHLLA